MIESKIGFEAYLLTVLFIVEQLHLKYSQHILVKLCVCCMLLGEAKGAI